jgi:hypothetical protein
MTMTLRDLLRKHAEGIVRRWLDDALASYSDHTSAVFSREKDPFANPVGHSLRTGTQAIFDAILQQKDPEQVRPHLHDIIKIRAVQEISASGAVSFVFHLKDAIRTELGTAACEPQYSSDWAELDGAIDRIALTAFDVFVQCRERLCDLRINEMKRTVPWIVDKMNNRGVDPGSARMEPGHECPKART